MISIYDSGFYLFIVFILLLIIKNNNQNIYLYIKDIIIPIIMPFTIFFLGQTYLNKTNENNIKKEITQFKQKWFEYIELLPLCKIAQLRNKPNCYRQIYKDFIALTDETQAQLLEEYNYTFLNNISIEDINRSTDYYKSLLSNRYENIESLDIEECFEEMLYENKVITVEGPTGQSKNVILPLRYKDINELENNIAYPIADGKIKDLSKFTKEIGYYFDSEYHSPYTALCLGMFLFYELTNLYQFNEYLDFKSAWGSRFTDNNINIIYRLEDLYYATVYNILLLEDYNKDKKKYLREEGVL